MDTKTQLLARLDAIGQSLASTGKALALIGLGSVGIELDRMDEYSDLDFFAIVQTGEKQNFIQNLEWMSAVHPVAYAFMNTVDGYKLMFEDGIFCEFAVFEPQELENIAFAEGRIVWNDPAFDPNRAKPPTSKPRTAYPVEHHVGEAVTNLYVGLGRYHRGEKLSAMRFIQGYAVDRILDLAAHIETSQAVHADPFSVERRFEARFPELAKELPNFTQGYERTIESARAILDFLDRHFGVNPAMRQRILELCDRTV